MKSGTFSKDSRKVEAGKRAVIYCRVSTDDQSCARQERDLTRFAQRAGYEVVGVYKEIASGTRNDRAARKQVLALAQKRSIDAVLVTELTRWGRSTVDLLETLETLNSFGVSVIAESGVQFDLGTAQGRMIAGMLSVLSQFERDLLSERTKSGLTNAVARGKKLGRPTGNVSATKHAAKVIQLRNEGLSIREIADRLSIGKTTVQQALNTAG